MQDLDRSAKAIWQTPVLTDLDRSPDSIQNGYDPISDGGVGYNTSTS
ncbi:hypothetical protein GRI62_04510 [Erythrobacter arachoides]|uniref:Uncharacterized protein n=1 Tax=Aurantiacibacter arachoides TaxID=1850444 RepID=A0A845A020_9SPHN|nr:hypothetical protein [Aurantiacibacter arachoides]